MTVTKRNGIKFKTSTPEELMMAFYGHTGNITNQQYPKKCALCGADIDKGDDYYEGVDGNNIAASTCASSQCTKWLEIKEKKTRAY